MIDNQLAIKGKIGQGSFSFVYLVEDLEENKYAAKIYTVDREGVEKNKDRSQCAVREATIMSICDQHPNIAKFISCNTVGEAKFDEYESLIIYNLIEYCENGNLWNLIEHTGAFDELTARFYFIQLLDALAYIHSLKIAHLDIKPSNILFDKLFNIKITDFGIAEVKLGTQHKSRRRKGTTGFMAPEVTGHNGVKEFDVFKADIYSLGITLTKMINYQQSAEEGKLQLREISENYGIKFDDEYSSKFSAGVHEININKSLRFNYAEYSQFGLVESSHSLVDPKFQRFDSGIKDVDSGKIGKYAFHSDFMPHILPVCNFVTNRNCDIVVTCSYDRSAVITNVETKDEIAKCEGHKNVVYVVAINSPFEDKIATCSFDRTVKIWDLSGELIHDLKGHTLEVVCVTFSPCCSLLASGDMDCFCIIWSVETGKMLHKLSGHSAEVTVGYNLNVKSFN